MRCLQYLYRSKSNRKNVNRQANNQHANNRRANKSEHRSILFSLSGCLLLTVMGMLFSGISVAFGGAGASGGMTAYELRALHKASAAETVRAISLDDMDVLSPRALSVVNSRDGVVDEAFMIDQDSGDPKNPPIVLRYDGQKLQGFFRGPKNLYLRNIARPNNSVRNNNLLIAGYSEENLASSGGGNGEHSGLQEQGRDLSAGSASSDSQQSQQATKKVAEIFFYKKNAKGVWELVDRISYRNNKGDCWLYDIWATADSNGNFKEALAVGTFAMRNDHGMKHYPLIIKLKSENGKIEKTVLLGSSDDDAAIVDAVWGAHDQNGNLTSAFIHDSYGNISRYENGRFVLEKKGSGNVSPHAYLWGAADKNGHVKQVILTVKECGVGGCKNKIYRRYDGVAAQDSARGSAGQWQEDFRCDGFGELTDVWGAVDVNGLIDQVLVSGIMIGEPPTLFAGGNTPQQWANYRYREGFSSNLLTSVNGASTNDGKLGEVLIVDAHDLFKKSRGGDKWQKVPRVASRQE
jgi:hypothetical protein